MPRPVAGRIGQDDLVTLAMAVTLGWVLFLAMVVLLGWWIVRHHR